MHTALYITGFGALILAVLTVVFGKMADRPGDDFGAVFPAIACGAGAILCALAWLILIIFKAATA